ncbi:hypothetical protein [Nocardioides sp.]|uniref:hypothetical protein n=1 Tax=Nocardioides sp. TaxID=35761 RepID=UPI002B26F620|nr:hypothetical protein [Nocardioides sp.]
MTTTTQSLEGRDDDVLDWTDLGQKMWDFLTGRQAAIHYRFEDMAVEVPRDTGANAPRATWKLHGTLTVTTSDSQAGSATAVGRS